MLTSLLGTQVEADSYCASKREILPIAYSENKNKRAALFKFTSDKASTTEEPEPVNAYIDSKLEVQAKIQAMNNIFIDLDLFEIESIQSIVETDDEDDSSAADEYGTPDTSVDSRSSIFDSIDGYLTPDSDDDCNMVPSDYPYPIPFTSKIDYDAIAEQDAAMTAESSPDVSHGKIIEQNAIQMNFIDAGYPLNTVNSTSDDYNNAYVEENEYYGNTAEQNAAGTGQIDEEPQLNTINSTSDDYNANVELNACVYYGNSSEQNAAGIGQIDEEPHLKTINMVSGDSQDNSNFGPLIDMLKEPVHKEVDIKYYLSVMNLHFPGKCHYVSID